jgi:hypothetical protein
MYFNQSKKRKTKLILPNNNRGWMNSNATVRAMTTARAVELN